MGATGAEEEGLTAGGVTETADVDVYADVCADVETEAEAGWDVGSESEPARGGGGRLEIDREATAAVDA